MREEARLEEAAELVVVYPAQEAGSSGAVEAAAGVAGVAEPVVPDRRAPQYS